MPLQDLHDALAALRPLLLDPDGLHRAVAAGKRRGSEPPYRRVELRPVQLKAGRHLQVVRTGERGPLTSNHAYDASLGDVVDELLALPVGNWHVESASGTVQLRVTKKGEAQVHRSAPPAEPAAPRAHDREKARLLDPGDPLFDVVGGGADKRRQVDAFLRTLDPVLAPVADRRPLRVVDLGCGNAYLTFAAYRFLTAERGFDVDLVGVDVKAQARERNTGLAERLGWQEHVRFVEGTIVDAPLPGADVVLALHACDTATDDALARAVRWDAPVVVAAPCCHHDVQRQLGEHGAPEPYGLLTRHGILRERFGDALTDALRAALLRLVEYRVDVVEFIDSKHTPRNVVLRAVRTGAPPRPEQVREYRELVQAWGLRPRLAELLADRLPG
ncbi:MAG: class I SAM-dependent methyltransferase [Motilibacteraceae bacterium]